VGRGEVSRDTLSKYALSKALDNVSKQSEILY